MIVQAEQPGEQQWLRTGLVLVRLTDAGGTGVRFSPGHEDQYQQLCDMVGLTGQIAPHFQ